MSKYVQDEIDLVREFTKQQTSDEESSTEAVSRNLILRFLSEADERIQSRVLGESPNTNLWNDSEEIETVSGQSSYDLPENIFAGDDVRLVEFSSSGRTADYCPLVRVMRSQIDNNTSSSINAFLTEGAKLVVSPIPSVSGQLIKVTYTKLVDTLDIRRGKISSVTNDGTDYTTIVLADDENLNESKFASSTFICICSRNGSVLRYNIEYDSYDSGSRTFTLTADQAMADGAIPIDSYVTSGRFTRTHSSLPDLCNRYRLAYAEMEIQRGVSNTDSESQASKVSALEEEAVKRLKNTWNGILEMPIPGFYI